MPSLAESVSSLSQVDESHASRVFAESESCNIAQYIDMKNKLNNKQTKCRQYANMKERQMQCKGNRICLIENKTNPTYPKHGNKRVK